MHVTGAASNDLDSVARQDVHGPAAHIPGQHHRYSHPGQLWDDARLASTAGRGSQGLFRNNLVLVIHVKDGETLAMAEVLIDLRAV
jgi:hypothetical protein